MSGNDLHAASRLEYEEYELEDASHWSYKNILVIVC